MNCRSSYLNGTVANAFYNKDWGNVDPGPWSFGWNMHQWYKKSLQPNVAP